LDPWVVGSAEDFDYIEFPLSRDDARALVAALGYE